MNAIKKIGYALVTAGTFCMCTSNNQSTLNNNHTRLNNNKEVYDLFVDKEEERLAKEIIFYFMYLFPRGEGNIYTYSQVTGGIDTIEMTVNSNLLGLQFIDKTILLQSDGTVNVAEKNNILDALNRGKIIHVSDYKELYQGIIASLLQQLEKRELQQQNYYNQHLKNPNVLSNKVESL